MNAREASTGTDARCGGRATAPANGVSKTYLTRRRLSPQQADLLDALRCMEWCEASDLMEAANIPTVNTLRVVITNLRIAGYDIANRKGRASLGRVCAYSLRGEP